jgi:hypothetical protein
LCMPSRPQQFRAIPIHNPAVVPAPATSASKGITTWPRPTTSVEFSQGIAAQVCDLILALKQRRECILFDYRCESEYPPAINVRVNVPYDMLMAQNVFGMDLL